jgi:transcriptional regulator
VRAIVGIELRIERLEGKAKLSQNRADADISGVISGLRDRGDDLMADEVERARP